jgi:hypothetical protein
MPLLIRWEKDYKRYWTNGDGQHQGFIILTFLLVTERRRVSVYTQTITAQGYEIPE